MRKGSKYDPLRDHLSRSTVPQLSLSIAEIEELLGFELCSSAGSPTWWANTKTDAGRAQRRAWRAAGFDAFLSADGETVEFKRVTPPLDGPQAQAHKKKAPQGGAFSTHGRQRYE